MIFEEKTIIRCGKTETHTVREWLTQFGIPIDDGYLC